MENSEDDRNIGKGFDTINILITGAAGFVGKNLTAALQNIRDGKDRTYPALTIDEIFTYDIDSAPEELERACERCDFVFNLAGVNRPQNADEFMQENFGFASTLLDTLKKYKNTCPVMLSSSLQATLIGRYDSDCGRSKKAGEELFFAMAKKRAQEYAMTLLRQVIKKRRQRTEDYEPFERCKK